MSALDELRKSGSASQSGTALDRLRNLNSSIDSANRMNQEDMVQTEKLKELSSLDLTPVQSSPAPQLPGRDIPVIGSVLKGLDYIASNPVSEAVAEYTVPYAPYLDQPGTNARQSFLDRSGQAPATGVPKFIGQAAAPFFVPGAQLGSGTSVSEAAQGVLTRFAPRLQGIGQAAAREGLAGAGIGAASEYAQGQNDIGNAAVSGLFGAGLGAAGGAAFRGLGTGLDRLRASRSVDNVVPTAAVQDKLRPTLPDNELAQIADEGLNRLAPDTNPYATDFMSRRESSVTPELTRPIVEPPAASSAASAPRTPNRQLIDNTFLQSDRLTPEVRSRLETSEARPYERITNQDTVDSATQRIGRGVDEAESFALSGKGAADAEQIATGFRLIDEFQRTGQTQRAVTMAERLAEKLTKAGQTVQAASIWNRLTPEGALISAQRKVNQINSELPKGSEKVKITEQQANDITQAAQAIQRSGASVERAGQVVQLMDKARSGQALSDAEKQVVSDFIKDANQYVTPAKQRAPRTAKPPREMSDKRVSDRVISFLDQQEAAARQRIAARRNTLSSTPFDVYADYAIIGASKLAKMGVRGATQFNDWASEMIAEYGEQIRPQLNRIYDEAQKLLERNAKRINQETISKAEKIADNYISKNEERLSPEDIQTIQDIARKVSGLSGDAQRLANQDLQYVLNGFEKAGIGQKVSATQYISMLLNPVTQVRNILGNELMYRLERLNRIAATPIDMAVSKITGKDRTITFKVGPGIFDNFFAPSQNYWSGLKEGVQAGWRGVSPVGLTTAHDIRGQAFRSKLNPLTYMEKALGAVMQGFDYAAYNRAVQQRLQENAYLDALNRGIRGRENIQNHMDTYLTNLDENIAKIASDYGKYITLQDNTALSNTLNAAKRGLNNAFNKGKPREFGVGSIALPFAKTPANLLMRAIDYSPLGVAKAISQAFDIIRNPNSDLTRADIIQSLTRALFGTGIVATGLWLAQKGVLRGESSKDADTRNLEKSAGLGQYQFNVSALNRMLGAMVTGNTKDIDEAAKIKPGDQLYQYEWAQPTSIPLAVGANIYQERKKAAQEVARGDKPSESWLGQTWNVTTGAINTLFQTSVLRGLQQAFDIPPGADNIPQAIGTNLVKQLPSMFTPSMVSRINQYMDNTVRETYGPTFTEKVLNPAQSRIPGLAQQLPQRVSALGDPQTNENTFLDVFLSPAQRSEFKPTPEAKIVFDLLNRTGEERVVPRTVTKYITGKDPVNPKVSKRVDLTPDQYVKFQQIVGEETAKGIGKLGPNLTDETKIKRILDIMDKAADKGRKEMRKELGLK